jgi:GMP synthase (glutamine-hydrolysing)
MGLRLLVVEGNERAARERLLAGFGKTRSQAYAETLAGLAPDAVCDICFPADPGANLPDRAGLAGYDGVVITGSALNIYNGGAPVERQIDLARAIFAASTPFFGSCWGLQVAAVAAGGSVGPNPMGREIGIARNIAPTEAGRSHPLLAGRPAAFDAPCVHLDIVAAPPEGLRVLASNAYAAVQAAEIRHGAGVFWGVQYHPEFSLAELAATLERYAPTLIAEGLFAKAEEAFAYCASIRALHDDPSNRALAWQLGVQKEIVDPHLRLTEIRNWLEGAVRPEKSRRGRA